MSLDGILAIAVGLIIAALGITVKLEADALAKARTQNGAQTQQLAQDAAALKTSGDSLTAALADVARWQSACAEDSAKLSQAESALTALEGRLDASQAALTAAEAKDRGTPQCAALLGADLAAVCPDIAGSLRERAATGHGH